MRLASSATWISAMMLSCILIHGRTCHAIKSHEQLSSVKFGLDFHLLCVKKVDRKAHLSNRAAQFRPASIVIRCKGQYDGCHKTTF